MITLVLNPPRSYEPNQIYNFFTACHGNSGFDVDILLSAAVWPEE